MTSLACCGPSAIFPVIIETGLLKGNLVDLS